MGFSTASLCVKGIFKFMGIVLVAAIFYLCIKHFLNYESPVKTTLLYASLSLVLILLESLFSSVNTLTFPLGLILFVYDLVTGYILFWLLYRYMESLLIFNLIIALAIVYSIATRFFGFFNVLSS